MQLVDILHTPGEENMPGLAQEIYYTEWENITGWPAPAAAPASQSVYLGAFTFATGTCWNRWYSTLETAELESKQVGERDCKNYESTITWKTPGSRAEILDSLGMVKNRNLVFIVREAGTGKMRMIGNKLFGASIEDGGEKGGMKGTDYKGFSMKAMSRHYNPAPIIDNAVVISFTPAV